MTKSSLSRRGFLKGATAGAGARVFSASAQGREPQLQVQGSTWERPPKQHGNDLNLIFIVSDTFRRDNLGCYGQKWLESLETPNLDRFAQQAAIFDDFYAELLPTIPLRRTLYTGRRGIPAFYFPQHEPVQLPGWHPLYYEDVTIAEMLQEAGYISTLIGDLYHEFKPGRNFQRGFQSYRYIRGQEFDAYGTSPHGLLDVSDIVSPDYLAASPGLHKFLSQYKANANLWRQQGESLAQIVAQTAIDWLRENFRQRPFYMQVEFFDPHEPWDPPARFLEKYLPQATGPSYIEPPYDTLALPEPIKQRFRANYAGETNCVDTWIGNLLSLIGELGLFENSIVVFMADHGAMLGERGQFLKGPDKLRGQVTHIPLLVRTPGKQFAGKRVQGFIQPPDVMPTVMHLLDLKPPSRVTGSNLWPLATGETKGDRNYVVQTYGWVGAVRDKEWSYTEIWKPEARQDKYSVSPGAPPAPYKPQLYNLQQDPQELTDVADKYPDVARRYSAKLKEYVASGEGKTAGSFHAKASLDLQEGLYAK
ncbi:MAG: sulfatase-like hydrolase/transferase [Terriglobia bacterium]